ncbi:DUF262 domain-containing protein [Ornithobacterium rhinotracheale]|uniref:DUF262 domain-containing protein n=5 Tax=Ornithobacterium rhinotracheale TaxID=28251 RepID=I4A122_ORNRL|nr:DUF262 domain-containing protein [Ornithobacterium rhinotracheale]AFL97656.1 hypothetical protein Ornrh_1483 [Ornithobacterium rhinotracheale DSM 15997]AIP98837.1 hypothetical protein Q785_02510 [Ornithobacterium rhinotracheale ORT-UMN 88]KGB67179.1 hypothetical protein Q787_02360 [Ornithobacterium rhinotracheale H06-030791]MCK0195046.1 DUF262 domain-containing HNH endonuclease family protein [Ornithobacterium rhinotracheale]MCK0200592.1 DUF262 domain-containing HNH endonuclease family prot
MKTESHSINDVLAKNATSFFIPPFQRAYAWGRPELERYFSDVSRIIESELDIRQQNKLEHFFGTIVIKEEKAGFANKSIIVDGQQRLTTTLLFLIALRDSDFDDENENYIHQTYLINNSSTFQDKIKLKQVTKDWDSYKALVNKLEPKPGVIKNAYDFFKKLIGDRKRESPQIKLEHYIRAIQKMNVAVIFLDERPYKGEDPQIIFETLNSLGKPLTLSDLVRNFVLLNMESNKQSEIYEGIWHPKIEAILNENTSKFFRDYLQYKTASSLKIVNDSNTKELYQYFKSFVEKEFNDHENFIDDIVHFVVFYKWIITEVVTDIISPNKLNDKKIKELLRNIFHDIKSEAFKPFVLGLLDLHQSEKNDIKLTDDILISTLTAIRTYLIRRRVLGLTQGENKNIIPLVKKIELIKNGDLTMFELLTNMFYRLRLPNDNEMKDSLTSLNFYKGLKQYSKLILGKIEEHNTKVAVDFRDSKITIEHIMPQTLGDSWKVELGEKSNEIHQKYIHNIGNLILTEFNSEIGNKSFEEKKDKIRTSSLSYRLGIIDKNIWNEESIIEHQKNMIKWFLSTFEIPDEYKEKANWNTKTVEDVSFSPLDIDANEMAEGNKPKELHVFKEVIEVNTWQDIFVSFLKYLRESQNFDFNFILDNQELLFKNSDIIVKWRRLKEIFEFNSDLSNRYKNFEGRFYSKEKKLNDEMFFIHINISASTCMNRIKSIMQKFNISENEVKVILK